MINLNKIHDIDILSSPFDHIVSTDLCEDFSLVSDVYNFFTASQEWNKEQDNQQFTLHEYNDQSTQLVNIFEEFNWQPILDRFNVKYSSMFSSFQGSNMEQPLPPHNDDPKMTKTVAKFLFYMTPHIDNGTRLHSDNGFITTPGAQGDFFMFKCSPTSFHSTDYSTINKDTKRIVLVGCFHE